MIPEKHTDSALPSDTCQACPPCGEALLFVVIESVIGLMRWDHSISHLWVSLETQTHRAWGRSVQCVLIFIDC